MLEKKEKKEKKEEEKKKKKKKKKKIVVRSPRRLLRTILTGVRPMALQLAFLYQRQHADLRTISKMR